ncbi:hypothetical protein [Helicobacter sp. 11S02596-1]|uniref:hypothetical protein n=1 Tax=Helicobacter sp. 11S02596-1 TaxID=1476194 RepID=UPI000BA5B9F6|nr:hypothetical protein [Helicobacter sp. 11S02596-1]PAF42823.1 hypothetical protein BJI48_06105 [Helicobacter sp. 11S02596-1]
MLFKDFIIILLYLDTPFLFYLWVNFSHLKPYEKLLVIFGVPSLYLLIFISDVFALLFLVYLGFLVSKTYQIIKHKNESKNFLVFIGLIVLLIIINSVHYFYQNW